MGWLWAIIVGLVLGLLAKAIIPGKQHIPLWLTVILGMIGGIAGNAIARAAGVEATSGIDWWRHIFQLVMAIILVGLGDRAWTAARGDRGKAKA
ncbi:Transglycosylase associated protein [Streptomyces sp. Ag82_O1-12]|uniref:GlsB/YeaQ/YmgE family stress response membrane protein n=1 Tax=unclassified Streptomyces TaxID=2593676 RepID=UPI000BD0CC4A|nr:MULTISPECIES: GlsB/YeaQ/YmgE family stress response membrane protein [unclassified Streptomyces]SMQ15357.1 Transglycosylase associated protein [Streptomyces sp. Ag82_O1-12]SOD44384.1 Transglycosylase associated protein [Streptomyces sp. Ag82_G6-1]